MSVSAVRSLLGPGGFRRDGEKRNVFGVGAVEGTKHAADAVEQVEAGDGVDLFGADRLQQPQIPVALGPRLHIDAARPLVLDSRVGTSARLNFGFAKLHQGVVSAVRRRKRKERIKRRRRRKRKKKRK